MKRQQIDKMMKQLNIKDNVFTSEELDLIARGGYQVSDSSQNSLIESDNSFHQKKNQDESVNFSTKKNRPNLSHQSNFLQQNIEAIQNKHAMQIENYQSQIDHLKSQLNQAQHEQELSLKRQHNEHVLQISKLNAELNAYQVKARTMDSYLPLVHKALQTCSDMANNLCSETPYLQLLSFEPQELHLSELVLKMTYDIIKPFKHQNQNLLKELDLLRQEIQNTHDKAALHLNEIEHLANLHSSKEESVERRFFDYETQKKQLQLEIQQKQNEIDNQKTKINSYNELENKYKELLQSEQLLQQKIAYYEQDKRSDSYQELDRIKREQQRKVDLLEQDKSHWVKEHGIQLEKFRALQERCDFLERQWEETQKVSQSYLQQLLQQKNSPDYEQRINRELNEMKEKQQRELELTKLNLSDIYEKQIRFLKDQKEEIELKNESYQNQMREKSTLCDQLMLENRNLARTIDSEMSDLRLTLRIKTEEFERLRMIQDDQDANLKSYKLENEMLREKLNILKSEYYKMEVNQKDEFIQMKANLAVAKEQLSNYEAIENEIDEAIIGLGGSNANQDNIYLQTIQSAPTSSKRRLQQAMNLAKRLEMKQRESEKILKENQGLKDSLEQINEELRIAKSLLDKSSHPYSYLISAIEEKEKEIIKYKQLLRKSEMDYEMIQKENKDLQFNFDKADNDIKKLMIKRENIQNIQKLLVGLATKKGNTDELSKNVIEDLNFYLQQGKQDDLSIQPEKLLVPTQKLEKNYQWADKMIKKINK